MRNAFTLVELMVVVTIIVILVSMLTPAVEEAAHQAKLARCGANLKVVGSAAIIYANDNEGYYPKRHENYAWDALHVRANYPGSAFDFRPKFTPYMTLESFLDPMLGGIDLSDTVNRPGVLLFSNFNIYTGLPLGGDRNGPAMDRVGQRFEWTDTLSSPGNPRNHEFSVIAGDRNMYWSIYTASSHPDRSNILKYQTYQDHPEYNITISQWGHDPGPIHGLQTLNYVYGDASVQRLDDVTPDDERMAKVAVTDSAQYAGGRYDHLPRR